MTGQYLIKGKYWTNTIYTVITMVECYIATETHESPKATVSKTIWYNSNKI